MTWMDGLRLIARFRRREFDDGFDSIDREFPWTDFPWGKNAKDADDRPGSTG